MKLLGAAAGALLLAAAMPRVAGHGQQPQVKAGQKQCTKKMLQDFIDCTYANDYDPQTGSFADPGVCIPQYNASFAACRGGFNYCADYEEFGSNPASPPNALAGGLDKNGDLFAYYKFPAAAGEPLKKKWASSGNTPYHYIDCKVCTKFVSKLLKCALPITPTDVTRLNGALWQGMRNCVNLTDPVELSQYYICSAAKRLPNGPLKVPPQWAPLYLNANGQIDYVMYTPSFVMDTFYQPCTAIEAYADPKTGRKTTKPLKGTGFNQLEFWVPPNICDLCPPP